MDIKRFNPTARWSDATIFNGIAHFVEVPADTSAALVSQVQQVLDQAANTLIQINSSKSHILSATIYITDFANVDLFNRAWEAWLPEGCAPSRACVKVGLADPLMLVEIAFVVAVK